MRHLVTSLLWLLFSGTLTTVNAQTYPHTALWLRMAPSYAVNDQWTFHADLLYRRQSSVVHGLLNPFDSPLLMAGRLGLLFRKKCWTYALFPMVYFHSYPALGKPADLERPPVPEWRPYVQAEWAAPLPHLSTLRLRAIYEYRLYPNPELPNVGRFRARVAYRRGLGLRTYTQLWNETLLGAPPNLPTNGHLFEINRTNLSVGYVVSNISTLEIGYQLTHRQRRSLIEFDDEHALTATLFCFFRRAANR